VLVVRRVGRARPDHLASTRHQDLRRPGKPSCDDLSDMTRKDRHWTVSELTCSTMRARPWFVPWLLDQGRELRKSRSRNRTEMRIYTLHVLVPNSVPQITRKSAGFGLVKVLGYEKRTNLDHSICEGSWRNLVVHAKYVCNCPLRWPEMAVFLCRYVVCDRGRRRWRSKYVLECLLSKINSCAVERLQNPRTFRSRGPFKNPDSTLFGSPISLS
jgi:hypothetical protein